MSDLLPFVVSGVATGAIGAGLLGAGLVLTYKTSGLFNFAHGAIASVAAYVFYWLNVEHDIAWPLAMTFSVLVMGPLLGLAMEAVSARLASKVTALKIVGTVGIVLLVQGLATIRYGSNTIAVEQFLPRGRDTFTAFGVVITYDKVIVTVVAVVAVTALYALFRWSRLGVAMRAVVEDPELTAMLATNPQSVRRVAWVIGSSFAALSGVLIIPFIGLDAILLTFLVVQAFGAAAVGSFASIPLTFAGGVMIGVAADISKKFVLDVSWLSGFPAALPFLVLFVALLVLPRHRLAPPTRLLSRPSLQYRAPWSVRLIAGMAVLIPLLLVPQLTGAKLSFYVVALVTVIMLLSLGLLVRTSGQVSLCHAAFAAIGAVAFSQFHVDHGLPWLLALGLAGLVTVPVGALVAIPAIRLSGLFLALATFGFGILVQRLFYAEDFMFTSLAEGRLMPKPSFAATPERYYYLVLALGAMAGLLIVLIQRSRLGRLLRAMSASPTAVTAAGLSTGVAKVVVFCISAYLAGVAGALLGVARGFAVSGDPFFGSFNSLILLAMLVVAPFAEPWYALVPAIGSVIPAYWATDAAPHWVTVFFGVASVAIAMHGGHPSMPARLRKILDHAGRRQQRSLRSARDGPESDPQRPAGEIGIAVEDLSIRFGGLVAVDGVSFQAPLGQVTGLIGPNGAGKTSTFDACSGFNRRFDGRVELVGTDVTAMSPEARARRGLGRTFQRMELGDSLTVLDNVAIGYEASLAGANPLDHITASPRERRRTLAAAFDAMQLCGIAELADLQAGALSTGHRRLVELARALAGRFSVLLLDEPSSGLDSEETQRFAALLRRVVAERGVGVLLVEHDMGLVMGVSDHVYVLDFGRLVFDGSPTEVAASDVVRAAYLGAEPLDVSPKPERAST